MELVWYCTVLLLLWPDVLHAMCITNCEGRATDDGMRYPDCADCDFYIICEMSGMVRKRCPLTLTFNADERNCDYPANAKCGTTSATTSQTTISPTTTSPTATTTSATTTPPGAPECRSSCDGVVGLRIYPDCGFCRDFRTCFGGHEVFHTCGSGLAYSHQTRNCLRVDQVNCGSSSPILTSSVMEGINQTTCVDDCSGRPDGNYQSCSTCHGFTSCSNGNTYKRNCAVAALRYDSTEGSCIAISSTCFYAG